MSLARALANKGIAVAYPDFSYVPYGKQLYLPVVLASSDDGCQHYEYQLKQACAVLISRKYKCTYSQKQRMAQEAGAKVLIIYEDSDADIATKKYAKDSSKPVAALPLLPASRGASLSLSLFLLRRRECGAATNALLACSVFSAEVCHSDVDYQPKGR